MVVAAAVVAVLALGAAAFLVVGGGGTSAEDELKDVQKAMAEATSFRFEYEGVLESEYGALDVSGKGVSADERAEVMLTDPRGVTESIYDDTDVYERSGANAGRVAGKKWAVWEEEALSDEDMLASVRIGQEKLDGAPDADIDATAVSIAQEVFLGGGESLRPLPPQGDVFSGMLGNPADLITAVEGMSDPKRDEDDALESTIVAPDDLVEAFGNPIPDGRAELTVGDDDLPTKLRYQAKQGDARARFTVTFTDWNDDDLEVALPAKADIDPTPWLDEDGLRTVRDVGLVWPTAPPEGWYLAVWSPEELSHQIPGELCEAVGLDWDEEAPGGPIDESDEPGYLYIVLRSAECAEEAYSEPFEPGGPGGFPIRQNEYDLTEVLVGDTAVELDSSLSDDELDAVIASLAPTDVETIIDAAPAPPDL
jgi:hypothetical protein